MADIQRNTNSVISWIALLLGALALPVAVVAYNRSGENLNDTVRSETNTVVDQAKDITDQAGDNLHAAKNNVTESAAQMKARTEMQARLMQVQDDVKSNQVTDETVTQIEDLRTDFKNAYADASGDIKERADQIDKDLSDLEMQVRQNTANAISNIESLLNRLKSNILTDDDNQ